MNGKNIVKKAVGCGPVEKQKAMIALGRIKPEFGSRTRPNKFDRATLSREFGLFQQSRGSWFFSSFINSLKTKKGLGCYAETI